MAVTKRGRRKAKSATDTMVGLGGNIAQSALRAAHRALTQARELVRAADSQLQSKLKTTKRASRSVVRKAKKAASPKRKSRKQRAKTPTG